jgi:predicted small secreted protein
MLKKIAVAVVLLISMWALSACHTVHGVGQDIGEGGEAIERSSGK